MKINNIQESKQGLKSKKLFDIVKSHGGFAEKTPSFYLNDITDNDVIGIVDGSVLDFLKKSYLDKRIQWAQKQGYVVNKGDNVEVIPLKDFTWVAIIERGVNLGNKEYLQTKIGNLKNNRYKNTLNRGDRQYQWSDTGKWGSPRAEEFFMRRNQNDIANQRRARYGNDAVYKVNESVLDGLDEIPKTIRDNENNNKINENNMSKIVLKEEDLMALVNESVKKVINEAVQNGELDEGFWGNIGQGIKGAFGGDANRVASAVRTGVDKAKNMGQNAYNAVKNAGQKVAGAAKDAYGTVQTGVNQRVNAFKANYAAGQNADKINNVISTLRELQQNGVISGAKTNATINELERLLQMGMRGMRGRATQASNRIGKEE